MVKQQYGDKVTMFHRSGGEIDPDTGGYIPGDLDKFYEGRANVQPLSMRDRLQYTMTEGVRSMDLDMRIYFPMEILSKVDIFDVGEIEFSNGDRKRFQITGYNRVSGGVFAKYLSGVGIE